MTTAKIVEHAAYKLSIFAPIVRVSPTLWLNLQEVVYMEDLMVDGNPVMRVVTTLDVVHHLHGLAREALLRVLPSDSGVLL